MFNNFWSFLSLMLASYWLLAFVTEMVELYFLFEAERGPDHRSGFYLGGFFVSFRKEARRSISPSGLMVLLANKAIVCVFTYPVLLCIDVSKGVANCSLGAMLAGHEAREFEEQFDRRRRLSWPLVCLYWRFKYWQHRALLYYNTKDGITAVMRAPEYVDWKEGDWNRLADRTLKPAPHHWARYFFDESACGRIPESVPSWPVSLLDDLRRKGLVDMKRKRDIFVPFVDEAVLSFPDQEQELRGCGFLSDDELKGNLSSLRDKFELRSMAEKIREMRARKR